MKAIRILLLACCWIAGAASASAQDVYCLENGVTADFMKHVVYPDDDYSYTEIEAYRDRTTDYRKDIPSPVRLSVPEIHEGQSLVLETYSKGEMVRSDEYEIGQTSVEVWNLIPQTSYTYRLFVLYADGTREEVANGRFRTEGRVRMMNIEQIPNCRDLGGWALPNDCRVKYDKLFRSGELATTSRAITDAGIHELVNVLNIDVELEFSAPYSSESPIADYIEHVCGAEYEIMDYTEGLRDYSTEFKNCFEKTVNCLREGKKVLFHCVFGSDRTGTFAFLLKGLLGVSESDLAKGHELSCFAWEYPICRVASTYGYGHMIGYIKDNFPGSTIHEKIENMALSIGISQTDIDDFRSLMIESIPASEDDEDDPSAISTATTNQQSDVYYNLQGQRVYKPSKGLYIVNGKKIHY